MRLGEKSFEQSQALLIQAEQMMKRVMDIAAENDDATVLQEASDIVSDIAILNRAILDRADHVSITEAYGLYGDEGEVSVEDSLEDGESDEGLDCKDCDSVEDCLLKFFNKAQDKDLLLKGLKEVLTFYENKVKENK